MKMASIAQRLLDEIKWCYHFADVADGDADPIIATLRAGAAEIARLTPSQEGTKLERLERLVAIAKEMGFMKAEPVYWEDDDPETWLEDFHDLNEDRDHDGSNGVALGVYLREVAYSTAVMAAEEHIDVSSDEPLTKAEILAIKAKAITEQLKDVKPTSIL